MIIEEKYQVTAFVLIKAHLEHFEGLIDFLKSELNFQVVKGCIGKHDIIAIGNFDVKVLGKALLELRRSETVIDVDVLITA